MGFRGLIKSTSCALRALIKPGKVLLHKNVLTYVEGDLDIEGRLIIGLAKTNASDPWLGKSKLKVGKKGKLSVGEGWANIGPCSVIAVENGGTLKIGDSYINSSCKIICEEKIEIGDGCAIAWNVDIADSDMHSMIYEGEKQPGMAPIKIGDNVWIGNNVTIKKGVTIGDGAVIASGSIVTKDIPEKALAAGVPAEVKKEDIEWGGIKKD